MKQAREREQSKGKFSGVDGGWWGRNGIEYDKLHVQQEEQEGQQQCCNKLLATGVFMRNKARG